MIGSSLLLPLAGVLYAVGVEDTEVDLASEVLSRESEVVGVLELAEAPGERFGVFVLATDSFPEPGDGAGADMVFLSLFNRTEISTFCEASFERPESPYCAVPSDAEPSLFLPQTEILMYDFSIA